jgi:hypothetical protein
MFKLNNPFSTLSNTPIHKKKLPTGINAEANSDGSINVDKSLKGKELDLAIGHEMVHLDQMKNPIKQLGYDDDYVFWKGKKYARDSMDEGSKDLPWEKEAWAKQGTYAKMLKSKKTT